MLTTEVAKLTTENMQVLHPQAFMSDNELTLELIWMEYGQGKADKFPLGIPLLSNKSQCVNRGGKLLLWSDRPSRITLYTI